MIIINDILKITRPMYFLCGPYYDDKDYDRRKILRDFLVKENKVIPIIVDKFLDKENVNDTSINIDLIEEICASVSFKTYIFLDTFSSVAELGIFSSKAYQNKIDVFLPKDTDIISNNIGYFINEIIQNSNNDKIETLYYRPKIVRVPLASDKVTEFFEFTKNELPQNIKDRIVNDKVYLENEFKVQFINTISTDDRGIIAFNLCGETLNFNISVRMLFYLVASLVLDRTSLSINEELVNKIVIELKEILKNSLCFYQNISDINIMDVEITTKISSSLFILVKHILVFINLYYSYGDYKGRHIVTKKDSFICEVNADKYFAFPEVHKEVINGFLVNPDSYIQTIKIKRGKKTRTLTKYRDDENGIKLRQIHSLILEGLEKAYVFSNNSFAYRKGISIKDCALPHKNSQSFLKFDIKSFFNSVKYLDLYECCKNILEQFFVINNELKKIIKACTYNNVLPLGLITSPILSDIYLHKLDLKISDILSKYDKKIIFTRYADDMFFSSEKTLDIDDIDFITKTLNKELENINLQINSEKTIYKNINKVGDHIKVLGLNIVKTIKGNEITVGKKFVNDTCKMYLQHLEKISETEEQKESRFYEEKIIAGRFAYITQIEGMAGYRKIKKRIDKATDYKVYLPKQLLEKIHLIKDKGSAS
jgi:hypothetical protein